MTKSFAFKIDNVAFNFTVDLDWVEGLHVKALEPIEPQIYSAAMSDPEKSGIHTDDDTINAAIEEVKDLVKKAAEINTAKNGDIKISMTAPGSYEVRFMGDQVYETGLNLREANRAIDKLSNYLDHNNVIKVAFLDFGDKTELQKAMDLEVFIARKAHKFLGTYETAKGLGVIYIPKGWKDRGREYDCDRDCCDD